MKDFETLNDRPFPNNDDDMDRFELLSAYLDGEVTADERRQVQQWLDTDPQVQKWYSQLVKLQHCAKYYPVPVGSQTTEQLSAQVFQKLDRRRNQRLWMVGGALVGAIALGLAFHFPGRQSPTSQMARTSTPVSEAENDSLMIAVNHPVVDIPLLEGEAQHGR